MVLPVRDVELCVAVHAEVPLQPAWLCVDLVQDSEEELLCGDGCVEDADALLIGHPWVSPCLDERVTERRAASKVGQEEGWRERTHSHGRLTCAAM